MTLLTDLPAEIIHNVLAHVAPEDLAVVPKVCRTLSHAVRDNSTLFKAVYLNHLDEPPSDVAVTVQWEQLLKDYVRLRVVCQRPRVNDKREELPFVYDTVTTLLANSATGDERASDAATYPRSRNADILASIFADETSQAAFLCRSSIYERARAETIYKRGSSGNMRGNNHANRPRSPRRENTNNLSSNSGITNTHEGEEEEEDPRKKNRMRSAKLHCLYGKPIQFAHPEAHRTRYSQMRPFACSRVYDLRQYTPQTQWGPFMGGGATSEGDGSGDATLKVDWEMVEAIMLVLGANLKKFGLEMYPIYRNYWATPFAGAWPNSYMGLAKSIKRAVERDADGNERVPCENCSRPISVPPAFTSKPDDGESNAEGIDADGDRRTSRYSDDPYGINGTWLRVVCFLDYNDFFAYNFAMEPHDLPPEVPRPAIDTGEATRLILMKIGVTEIEEPGPDDSQDMPVVHFRGISRSLDDSWDDNANSDLAGTVRMTKEGEVRWTTVSIFAGVERWKSESVQIGGVRSARGVLGNWFDRDYDPRGPVGPTAFWKISDQIAASNAEQRAMLNDFLPMTEIEMDADYEPLSEDDDEDDEDEEDEDDRQSREDDEAIGGSGSEEERTDGHNDAGGEGGDDTDEEMTEADRAQLAAYLATQPELEIIEADDIDTHGTQLFWRSRE